VIVKYKKIVAREALVLLVSCLFIYLYYGYFIFYNWRIDTQSAEFEREISKLESNDVVVNFNKKKAARINFFIDYLHFYRMEIRSEDGFGSERYWNSLELDQTEYYKFWETIFSWSNRLISKDKWSYFTSNKYFVDFCVDQGFMKPEDLFNFSNSVYWTNLEVQNVRNINDRINSLEKEQKRLRYFSDDQVRKYSLYAIFSVFGVVFVLRYIIILTLWSVRTLRDKSQNS
jgi:hypothetical protein